MNTPELISSNQSDKENKCSNLSRTQNENNYEEIFAKIQFFNEEWKLMEKQKELIKAGKLIKKIRILEIQYKDAYLTSFRESQENQRQTL